LKIKKIFFIIIGFILGIIRAGILILILILIIPSVIINFTPISYEVCENAVNSLADYLKNESVASNNLKKIVVYNGTTVENGIKSNKEIDTKTVEITKNACNDRQKAEEIYKWIGTNIQYDNEKADIILSKNSNSKEFPESGAICAYNTGRGICFDKACLYVAMARAAGLKVKLISGEAFDGKEYVGHAWNEVYLNDESKWINVDSTFYDAGNYFDSDLFSKHKANMVAGEW